MLPIFVINLRSSSDRWQRIAPQLSAQGLSFVRVEAVAMDEDLSAAMGRLGARLGTPATHALGRAETACYLSHLQAWRLALEQGCDAACILEDDAKLAPHFPDVLKAFSGAGFAIWRLEPWHRRRLAVQVGGFDRFELVYTPQRLVHAAGYCISRPAMERAIPELSSIEAPFDDALYDVARHDVATVMPAAVKQDRDIHSLISGDRKNRKSADRSKLAREVTRPIERCVRLFRDITSMQRRHGFRSLGKLRWREPQELQPFHSARQLPVTLE
jgi:glycosyl transferase family 25